MPIRHLVQATATGEASTYWTSMAAPLAVLGILGVLGALLRFRLLLGFAWMTGVAVTVLWILMRVISSATSQSSESADLRYGVWVCVAGLVIIMVGIAVMGPRREEIEAPLSVFDDDDDPPE
jgi:peptidoglycan/LPS O-acetylase OafA/YrhL